MKTCAKCQSQKSLECFGKLKTEADGLQPRCRACRKVDSHRFYLAHVEAQKSKSRRYHAAKPQIKRAQHLKKLYGLTAKDYDAKLAAQKGVCAICGKENSQIARTGVLCRMHVDHDHNTGQVRGLLCNHCNRGLGAFKDDTQLLQAAIRYLQAQSV